MTDQHSQHHRPAFTLAELVVVMGIIVLLMGLVLAAVSHALKAGRRSRVQADFQTIGLALEAYKTDFGDYPRFPGPGGSGSGIAGQWDQYDHRGAELLCRALIGPGPAFANPPVASGQKDNSGADGAGAGGSGTSSDPNSMQPGPGFRTRLGVDNSGPTPVTVSQGKVWGPYISPDKFRVCTLSTILGLATVNSSATTPMSSGTIDATCVLLDSQNHTILYFPASPNIPNLSTNISGNNGTFISYTAPPSPSPSLYNYYDNSSVPPDPLSAPLNPTPLSQNDFETLLGDANNDGAIDGNPPETPAYTGPYILWSAGADGVFGLLNGKSDDITNFDFPLQYRK